MSINKATLIGKSDESLLIRITIVVRRRVGHHPIPKFSDYLNCPPRTRLSNEEFAAKYGASVEDIGRIKSFYKSFGLKLISVHLARRHIILEGSVQQHNAAFGIELHDYEKVHVGKTIRFRSHATPIQLPDHLKSIIHDVWKLENEPKMVPCLVKQTTNPASDPSSTSVISLSTLQSLYKVPTNLATGQNIAIGLFQGWGQFSINDLTSTCNGWGIPVPKITTIIIDDTIILNEEVAGETQLDASMCAGFGQGAAIVFFVAVNFTEVIARVAFPDPGEQVCSILTISGFTDETYVSATDLSAEDAAIQGITICAASGDWGTADSSGTVIAGYPASSPYVTAVGGTVIGNISGSTFTEWLWNDNTTHHVSGSGVSIMYGVPSYQNNVNIPATLTTVAGALSAGTPGRGLPDIAANASPDSAIDGMYVGGVITAIGGTSAASPLMAGIFARINASLGYNVGFINPTLYMLGTNNSYARCMNSGGATSNAWTDTSVTPSVNYPGYNLSLTSWNACVGLGVINATNLLAYIKTNNVVPVALKNYFIKIQASNGSGNGPMSIASGPFTVTT